jgi:hypothetical protein
MSLMPPPGPQRRRLFILLGLLAIASVVLYYQWSGSETAAPAVTTARTSANPVDKFLNETATVKPAQKPGAGAPLPGAQVPEALKLDQIENKVPDEPEAERNLFRFGVPPPPPPPPPRPVIVPPPVVEGPPPPPPIPPVPLKYTVYIKDNDGRNRGFLVDRSGVLFEVVEGQTAAVDGKYKLYRITPTFVEMSWLDGTGRRTIPLSGG